MWGGSTPGRQKPITLMEPECLSSALGPVLRFPSLAAKQPSVSPVTLAGFSLQT